jgi:hypothetical protein
MPMPNTGCCDCDVPAPPPPPVTASVTGLPCPLPAQFVWQGITHTTSSFIAAVQAQVAGATYNAGACSFSAPSGSVFPALVVSAVPPVPVVYCPSQRLPDGGYGFHTNDPKDPTATVEIAPCAGDTSVETVWVYPTSRPGATTRVEDCAGALIGYASNNSTCAPDCGCPDMNITVQPAVNNVTVQPAVNNFAPAVTNNFAPTTNVAAPNVTLPSPNIVAAEYDPNGKLTLTNSQGGTVATGDLPTC